MIQHSYSARTHDWRVQSDDRGRFDELVVRAARQGGRVTDKGLLLHAEMTKDDEMFVNVAGVKIWVWVDKNGVARITWSEDGRAGAGAGVEALRDPRLDGRRARKPAEPKAKRPSEPPPKRSTRPPPRKRAS